MLVTAWDKRVSVNPELLQIWANRHPPDFNVLGTFVISERLNIRWIIVKQYDLNPVIVRSDGYDIVDARMILKVTGEQPYARQTDL